MTGKLENKAQKAKRIALEYMPTIVRACEKEPHYIFTPDYIHQPLIKLGYVEINPEMSNEAEECATRVTESGIAFVNEHNDVKPKTEEVEKMFKFIIEKVAVEKPKRKGGPGGKGRESIYPFAVLEVGESFFVPATETCQEPWKSLASTVVGAKKRFAVQVKDDAGVVKMRTNRKGRVVEELSYPRLFAVVKSEKDGVTGARIGRIQ